MMLFFFLIGVDMDHCFFAEAAGGARVATSNWQAPVTDTTKRKVRSMLHIQRQFCSYKELASIIHMVSICAACMHL
jgi:hypothetical protein